MRRCDATAIRVIHLPPKSTCCMPSGQPSAAPRHPGICSTDLLPDPIRYALLRRPRRPTAKRLANAGALTNQVSEPWSGTSAFLACCMRPALPSAFCSRHSRKHTLCAALAPTNPTLSSQGLQARDPPSHGSAAASGSLRSSQRKFATGRQAGLRSTMHVACAESSGA